MPYEAHTKHRELKRLADRREKAIGAMAAESTQRQIN